MAAEIVHDDDVARPERRHQELSDIGLEVFTVDRAVEDHRRDHAGAAQPPASRRQPMALPDRPDGVPIESRSGVPFQRRLTELLTGPRNLQLDEVATICGDAWAPELPFSTTTDCVLLS